ncbi:MAG: ornithine carbamoyltransferase, partial [Acidobacteria bacterium]|nr:ornithine carbamoyltransferase [Acidobacteriota bacterium]
MRHDLDLKLDELRALLDLASAMKREPARFAETLKGKAITLLFEKPSLRTRYTFEIAIQQLGGFAVTSIGMVGEREPLKDVARNLERWTQGIVARVFAQQTIDDLAQWSRVPVVNALSDLYHPCQALADVQTIGERFGRWEGLKLAYIGDGNNVAHSLMLTAGRLGMSIAVACPAGYEPNAAIVAQARAAGVAVDIVSEAAEAAAGAHVIYTDVWASMGQESEALERQRIFAPYQVDESLMARAASDAIFLHCLPAKRGLEVTDAVMESPQSAIFDQA